MKSTSAKEREQAIRVLRICALFKFLTTPQIEQFIENCALRTYAPGELICKRGEPGSEFFVVVEGTVLIHVPTSAAHTTQPAPPAPSPAAQAPVTPSESAAPLPDLTDFESRLGVVRIVGAGEFLGEVACLEENGVRTANATAWDQCRVLAIPRDDFLLLIQSNAPAAVAVVRHLAQRLRYHTGRMAGVLSPDDFERLVESEKPASATRWQKWRACSKRLWHWATDWSLKGSVTLTCFVLHLILWACWLLPNLEEVLKRIKDIDGLTLVVSLEAIVLSIFVLISQRRAEDAEKTRKELQFQWASVTVDEVRKLSDRLNGLEVKLGAKLPPHPSSLGPFGF